MFIAPNKHSKQHQTANISIAMNLISNLSQSTLNASIANTPAAARTRKTLACPFYFVFIH